MDSRYGITIPFDGVSLRDHKEWFHRIADLGYTDLWSAEVDGTDGFTPLTLAAIWEPSLNLGVAVTPTFTRGAGLLAMTIAAMAEVAEGRFIMGLGASSEPVVQRWNGSQVREALRAHPRRLAIREARPRRREDRRSLRDLRSPRLQALAPSPRAPADTARGAAPGHAAPRRPKKLTAPSSTGSRRMTSRSAAPKSARARRSPRASSSCPRPTPTSRA
jgi:alkanesulfonate monooxygenase SsuD/methylene tetrahydromethanopterin reductase-like flavin-dependent oxidoreductase (luciferase family)